MTAISLEGFPAAVPDVVQPLLFPQARPRVLVEDLTAAHQIVVRSPDGRELAVSCTCRREHRKGTPYFTPIEARDLFPAPDLIAAWRAWHRPGVLP